MSAPRECCGGLCYVFQPMVRIYDIPDHTFESDDDDESSSEDDEESESEGVYTISS